MPKETQATRAATPTTRTIETVRRATSGTLGREKWANTAAYRRPPAGGAGAGGVGSQVLADPDDGHEHGQRPPRAPARPG